MRLQQRRGVANASSSCDARAILLPPGVTKHCVFAIHQPFQEYEHRYLGTTAVVRRQYLNLDTQTIRILTLKSKIYYLQVLVGTRQPSTSKYLQVLVAPKGYPRYGRVTAAAVRTI